MGSFGWMGRGALCSTIPGAAAVALSVGLMRGQLVTLGTALLMMILEPWTGLREKEVSGEGAGNTFPGKRPIRGGAVGFREGQPGPTARREGCGGSTAAWVSLGKAWLMGNVIDL